MLIKYIYSSVKRYLSVQTTRGGESFRNKAQKGTVNTNLPTKYKVCIIFQFRAPDDMAKIAYMPCYYF